MKVQLRFAKPGFFLTDAQLTVTLDGNTVYAGSFNEGFETIVEMEPGTHTVKTAVPVIGGLEQTQTSTVHLAESSGSGDGTHPPYALELRYSRLWGNFKRSLTVARLS